MDKEIFTLVSKEKEKVKLFQDLANARAEVICKGDSDNLCKLKAYSYNDQTHFLECNNNSTTVLKNGEEFLGYFFLGGEKYYFEGNIQVLHGAYSIALPKELYHLQRRQNYRVKVPESYGAHFDIFKVNGQPQPIKGVLANLSSQGCLVVYRMDNPLMKVGDKLDGNLFIGEREGIELEGIVRHIKVDDKNKVIQTFGIEFTPLNPILENRLFAITMEIHKEIFKRN